MPHIRTHQEETSLLLRPRPSSLLLGLSLPVEDEDEERVRAGYRSRHRSGFTLIELILVMALLAVVLAAAAPSLSRFFRGRKVDSEATRFLALTRYGQTRAVCEGIPMLLWIDSEGGQYGLEADTTFVVEDSQALTYDVDESLLMDTETPKITLVQDPWSTALTMVDRLPTIRFTPDGFISETSPERVLFVQNRDDEDSGFSVELSHNRLYYELQPDIERHSR